MTSKGCSGTVLSAMAEASSCCGTGGRSQTTVLSDCSGCPSLGRGAVALPSMSCPEQRFLHLRLFNSDTELLKAYRF